MAECSSSTAQLQNLLDLAAQGPDAGYAEIINLAAGRLQRLTGKMLGSYPHLRRWEDTSDVFQTAAIRLHQSLAEVKPDSVRTFFGLAATQIRRSLIDLARHHFGPQGHAARQHTDAGVDHGGGIIENKATTERPETLVAWAEFHQAVEQLPEAEREVFELVWYGGMAQQDIASMLGISVPTVQRRFRMARRQLHRSLHGESPLDTEASEHD
jgi:RNA polymerase sigma-70 factor (ECF subfamily)